MRWWFSFRSVDIWWEPCGFRWPYKRSFGYHHIYLPPGLIVRWGRSTRAMLKDQGVTMAEWREWCTHD